MSDLTDQDNETTGILLGVGTGILIGVSTSSVLTTVLGILFIMTGLAYRIYQRMKVEGYSISF